MADVPLARWIRPHVPALRKRLQSPPVIRYAGLAGALLLAVSGYFGGALPGHSASMTPVSIWQGRHGPLILATWLVGTSLLVGAWWAARHVVPSVRWAYLTVGLWLLPLLVAPPLGSRDIYSYACQGYVYAAGHNPYLGGVADFGCPWVDSVSPIWRHSPAPYGPVFVAVAGAAAAVGGTLTGTLALLRLAAVIGVGVLAAGVPALARRGGVSPRRALWLTLACPLVTVHLVSGAHNDALMVGLLVAGLLTAATWPRRAVPLIAAGGLLGLAICVKVTALVAVPFAMIVAMGGPYRLRRLVRDGGWVAAGTAGTVFAASYASGLGFGWVGGLSSTGESVQWTSPPTAVGLAIESVAGLFGVSVDAVPVTRVAALPILAVILVGLWWRARHAAALLGAGLALAATVALAPVFHPWYGTWPLAVLAATSVGTAWFALPALLASFLTLPDGTNLALFTRSQGALAMSGVVVWAAWRGLRWVRRPALRGQDRVLPEQDRATG